MLIKGGLVLDFDKGCFTTEDIRVCGSKITEMAPSLAPQAGEDVLDASGSYITPGLIDAHSHLLISEEGMGSIGDDCCDYSDALTPHLEVLDGMYPFDRAVERSARAGVTSVLVCPGSDGVIGGVCSVAKLKGTVADEMIVLRHAAMKGALGENPKTAKHGSPPAWALPTPAQVPGGRQGISVRPCPGPEERQPFPERPRHGKHGPGAGKEDAPASARAPVGRHLHRHPHRQGIRSGRGAHPLHRRHRRGRLHRQKRLPRHCWPQHGCASKNEVWAKSFETAGGAQPGGREGVPDRRPRCDPAVLSAHLRRNGRPLRHGPGRGAEGGDPESGPGAAHRRPEGFPAGGQGRRPGAVECPSLRRNGTGRHVFIEGEPIC